MIYPCKTCKFAEWHRTAAGRLHPSGDGRCTWAKTFQIAGSAKASTLRAHGDPITISGGFIDRKDEWPRSCAVYQPEDA